MLTDRLRQTSQGLALALALGGVCASQLAAQTPAPPRPPANPAQQDATRPPGTEQNQSIPPQARPTTQDPTAPPGTERPAPQAPPGSNVAPQQTPPPGQAAPGPPTTNPNAPTPLTAPPLITQPLSPKDQNPLTARPGTDLSQPTFPNSTPRPVPPVPSLTRLGITANSTLSLSLNEAVRRALENNPDIEVARDTVRLAETQLRSLQGVYDPTFTLFPQIDYRVTPQQSRIGGGGSSGTVSSTTINVNPSVTKLFENGGGNYQFFFNNSRQTTSSTFSLLTPTYSSNLGVTFTQPLWRNRAIDRFRHDIRVQRKIVGQSDADFRRRTIDIIQQVQTAYWDLVFALRDQQNQLANLNLARENFRQVEAQIAAGSVAPLERAQVETELATREGNLISSAQTVSVAENSLKQLIFRDPNVPEWYAPIMPTDEPVFDSNPVNLADAEQTARVNRPELQRLRLQHEINDIDRQFFRNQTRPQVDLQGTVSLTGLAGSPVVSTGSLTSNTAGTTTGATTGQIPLISGNPATDSSAFLLSQINQIRATQGLGPADVPLVTLQTTGVPSNLVGGYGQMLRNLLGFGTRNVTVGVTIGIPFHNTTAKANLAGAEIQRSQLDASVRSQEQAVEVDVRNAAQAVETNRRLVMTARAARQNAEIQLQGEQRLFQVGRSTTFLLFQRENELANARNTELRAETDYNKALGNLQHATATTLQANHVVVETPTAP